MYTYIGNCFQEYQDVWNMWYSLSEIGRIQTQVRHECSIRVVQDKDDSSIRVFQLHLQVSSLY